VIGRLAASKDVKRKAFVRLWGLCCVAILGGILVAGLWPFRAPLNQVHWLPGQDGLQFGGRGIAIGESPFHSLSPEGPAVLEISLRPSGSGTILAFDDFPDPGYVFALRQFDGSLVIQRPATESAGNLVREWWATRGVFSGQRTVVLTIVSSQDKATLYVNGVRVSESKLHNDLARDLSGTLVLGSSVVQDGWRGQITGLAIYNSLLTPAQIADHSNLWLKGKSPVADGEPLPVALYLFNERAGSTVHDKAPHTDDSLSIPHRYRLEHREFLTPVWVPFRSRWDGWRTWSYWSDDILNVVGFIPLGYFFATWFFLIPLTSRPRLAALLFGVLVSFAIESLQYYLPTRDSSMTDLVTNTIGAALGAALFREAPFKSWIAP
jgi:hypothetical protein